MYLLTCIFFNLYSKMIPRGWEGQWGFSISKHNLNIHGRNDTMLNADSEGKL